MIKAIRGRPHCVAGRDGNVKTLPQFPSIDYHRDGRVGSSPRPLPQPRTKFEHAAYLVALEPRAAAQLFLKIEGGAPMRIKILATAQSREGHEAAFRAMFLAMSPEELGGVYREMTGQDAGPLPDSAAFEPIIASLLRGGE